MEEIPPIVPWHMPPGPPASSALPTKVVEVPHVLGGPSAPLGPRTSWANAPLVWSRSPPAPSCQGIAGAREQGVSTHDLKVPQFGTTKVPVSRKTARSKPEKLLFGVAKGPTQPIPCSGSRLSPAHSMRHPPLKLHLLGASANGFGYSGSVLFEPRQRRPQVRLGAMPKGVHGPSAAELLSHQYRNCVVPFSTV